MRSSWREVGGADSIDTDAENCGRRVQWGGASLSGSMCVLPMETEAEAEAGHAGVSR